MTQTEPTPMAGRFVPYHHGLAAPYVWRINLSTYPNKHAGCHWHEELEWIYIESGRMLFFVAGEKMLLGAGDSLFINAGQLHYGYSVREEPCRYLCVLFRSSMFAQNAAVRRQFLDPLTQDEAFSFHLFLAETPVGGQIGAALKNIWQINEKRELGYQFDVLGQLLPLMAVVARERKAFLPVAGRDDALAAQKRMLAFIAGHYAEKITMEQIAGSAGLDVRKANALFQKYLGQTAQKYLIAYRLEASGNLLTQSEKSVAEISALSGFRHVSYYGKMFELAYGCSPTEYRKRRREGREAAPAPDQMIAAGEEAEEASQGHSDR